MPQTKFATSIFCDQQYLKEPGLPWRKYVALTHRLNQKQILANQERLMTTLRLILVQMRDQERTKDDDPLRIKNFKASYMKPVETMGENLTTQDGKQLWVENRLKFRKYL